MELAYTIGFDRTRMMGTHLPSPGNDGISTGTTFCGRLGIVVVGVGAVVVDVVSPGSVLVGRVVVVVLVVVVLVVDVVLVLLVVWPGSVVVVGGVGHDAVATTGMRTAGDVSCFMVVVVWALNTVVSGAIVAIGVRASDAAGATAGALS
jgi:hypothetical protein